MSIVTPKSRALLAISFNTFREAVRNKVFGSLVFFAILLVASSFALGQMSLHQEVRVARNLSLFTTSLFAALIAVYSSITLLHTEMERRTIYTILSKPIRRWEFMLGKYIGIQWLLWVMVAVLFGVSSAVITAQGGQVTSQMMWAHGTLALQLLIVTALALFLASFSSPLLSGLITMAIFVAGNLISQLEDFRQLLAEQQNPMRHGVDLLTYILPNLESLNLSIEVTHSTPISSEYLFAATWYALSYAAITMCLGMLIFSRRDFA